MIRMKNESFDDFKARRNRDNIVIKGKLQGRVIWNSSIRGTARSEKRIIKLVKKELLNFNQGGV